MKIPTKTLSRLRSDADARSAALIGGADVARLGLQAVYFLLLAATLGAAGFGLYAGTVALVVLVQMLGSWGTTDLLLKHVSIDRGQLSHWLGSTMAVTVVTSAVLSVVLLAVAPLVLGDSYSLRLLLPLLVSDLLALRVVEIFWAAFLSVDRVVEAAVARLGWAVVRVIALVVYVSTNIDPSPESWAAVQAVFLGLLAVGYLVHIRRILGVITFDGAFRRVPAGEGFAFAIGSTSETVYGDADKALLLRYEGDAVAGSYTAAYRLISFAFVPVSALVVSKLTSMYRAGHASISESLDIVRRYAGLVLVYAVVAGAVLVGLARVIPEIIGEDFSDMAVMTLALAGMPLLQSSHRILGAVLMTSGEVHRRGAAQVFTAGANILLSIILISHFSWQGAVMSTYASELALLGIFVAVIVRRRRIEAAELLAQRAALR